MYRLLLLLFITKIGYSQTKIKGEVIDGQTSETLIGANIIIKSAKTGTATDYNGKFILETNKQLPLTLQITYLGYKNKEILVEQAIDLKIKLFANNKRLNEVKVVDTRLTQKQKESPLTLESLDRIAIKSSPSANFYDALGALKGVDISTASLGFKVINTRGFNSTSPVRSLQLIDGVDNQAPGLNFSLGNFLGASELDIMKVDIIQGANSAYYGPGAFNGVISMKTRSPFIQPGLSLQYKFGSRQLFEQAVRFAHIINFKNKSKIGYKVNFSYLQALDWEANNMDAVYGSDLDASNPGSYDAVNRYGDEDTDGNINDVRDNFQLNYIDYPGLGKFYRTGYLESDIVDYNTSNTKFSSAIHFINKGDIEFIYGLNYGGGTTVYQGDNRFSLKNIQFLQNKIEIKKNNMFFLRAYRSQEDAGDSFDAVFTAQKLQNYNGGINNQDWYSAYKANYRNNFGWANLDWAAPTYAGSSGTGLPGDPFQVIWTFDGDTILLNDWAEMSDSVLSVNSDAIIANHQSTREIADALFNRLEPGTEAYNNAINDITSKISYLEGGTGFYDKSSLNHIHGEYQIPTNLLNMPGITKIGANFRQYTPDSKGSIFMDTITKIINNEFGAYIGNESNIFNDKLKINSTLRADKNENFSLNFSPAASLVFKPNNKDIIRLSFGSAVRNPTLSDQYLYYNVGRAILIGNLNGHGTDYNENLVTIESLINYLTPLARSKDSLKFLSISPIQPEETKSIEIGYRSVLSNKIYVDANIYFSSYTNFIGYKIGAKFDTIGHPEDENLYEMIDQSIQVYRIAANSENSVTTRGASIGINYYVSSDISLNGNYSYNELNEKGTNDPIIPAYNTPKHKFNLGLLIKKINFSKSKTFFRDYSFGLNYKWVDTFLYEGSPQFTGIIPSYDLLDLQISKFIPQIDATIKFGSTNILNNQHFEVYGGPYVGRMVFFSILFELD